MRGKDFVEEKKTPGGIPLLILPMSDLKLNPIKDFEPTSHVTKEYLYVTVGVLIFPGPNNISIYRVLPRASKKKKRVQKGNSIIRRLCPLKRVDSLDLPDSPPL